MHLVALKGLICRLVIEAGGGVSCRFAALQADRQHMEASADPAAVLSAASPGRQEPLWDRLHELRAPTLFVAGAEDTKFSALARKMAAGMAPPPSSEQLRTASRNHQESPRTGGTRESLPAPTNEAQPNWRVSAGERSKLRSGNGVQVAVIESCGHAVHVERPEALVPLLRSLVSENA